MSTINPARPPISSLAIIDKRNGINHCPDRMLFCQIKILAERKMPLGPALERFSGYFPDGFDSARIPMLQKLPQILSEKDLVDLINCLDKRGSLEAVAFIDEAMSQPSARTAAALIGISRRIGDYHSAITIAEKRRADGNMKGLAKELKEQEKKDARMMAVSPFEKLAAGEIDYDYFQQIFPPHLKKVLFRHIKENFRVKYYTAIRMHDHCSEMMGEFLDAIVDIVFDKVQEGKLAAGSEHHRALELILADRELDYYLPLSMLRKLEKRILKKIDPDLFAKRMFEHYLYRYYRRGKEYYFAGNFPAAWVQFKSSIERCPGNPILMKGVSKFLWLWGKEFMNRGRLREAEEKFREALKLDPNNKDAAQALKNVRMMP